MNILVLGAGAWGTAVAISAAQHPAGHGVTLWTRNAQQCAAMQATRCNARYLPDRLLPPGLALVSGALPVQLAARADVVIVAHPPLPCASF